MSADQADSAKRATAGNATDVLAAGVRREDLWRELEKLLASAERHGLDHLGDADLERFCRLYRATATHLALAKAGRSSERHAEFLNDLVRRAHALLYGRSVDRARRGELRLAPLRFPETVRRTAKFHALALILLLLGAAYGYTGAGRDPEWALSLIAAGDDRTPYATEDELRKSIRHGRGDAEELEKHETVDAGEKTAFAAFLWQHNVEVALLSFFAGFLAGIPTALLTLLNGVTLGVYSRIFQDHGLAWEWWAWILPHGVTELLALVLLGGGGFWIASFVLAPGRFTRAEQFRRHAGDLFRLVAFAFVMLLIAAIFESFVRQSSLSDGGRYVFAATTAALWAWYFARVSVPERTLARLDRERTTAERAVPLPEDEELLELLTGRTRHTAERSRSSR